MVWQEMRAVAALVVLVATAGCNRVFGLERPDTPADAAEIDVAVSTIGCADGTRELLEPVVQFPTVAGCAGSWTVPGVTASGPNTAMALCAEGWHICAGASEFRAHGGMCVVGTEARYLFVTAQQSSASLVCDGIGANEVFGCGIGFGLSTTSGCLPLDRAIGTDTVAENNLWNVGEDAGLERNAVTKAPGPGGVLCCAGT